MINPFRINIDPMNRLLLVNIENDPDSTYIGFEPQVFEDAVNGKGHLVIGWRKDGRVDVFHESSLTLRPEKYNITGKGLANIVETQFSQAFYEISSFGVQAHYEFTDILDRKIVLTVREKNPKKRKPFGLLAPMGHAAESPSSMPLVFLYDFYFVRKNHTEITIGINGRTHKPDKLPLPMDWSKMYFARYSPKPLIALLNPAFSGVVDTIKIPAVTKVFEKDGHTIHINWNQGEGPSIEKITRVNETQPVELCFEPAFPDLQTLPDTTHRKGRFTIKAHSSTGSIEGFYTIDKTNNIITAKLIPSLGWIPRPTKFSLRLIYGLVKIFKNWPSTYEWNAVIKETDHQNYSMQSQWNRKG
ncbi:hypothetical protein CHISP_0594 [Chitinispirillum alkaliphilum]|nr:hypothetical protein CHISP_0594 [Chitinispirillum alkaliphilum]